MQNKKQVLQGIDNFKRLIDDNGYYVDKTAFAKDLIDRPVCLSSEKWSTILTEKWSKILKI